TVFVPVFCPSRFHLPAFLCSTGITPFLRSYEGSVAFRVRFFGPSAGHERRSFPEERSLIHVAPTSCHSITTHPMHSFSCAHCLAAGRGRRSCLALHGSASGSGLRSPYASSPMHQAVSCSTLFYLWTGSSSPVASHPAFRRRSFLRLRTASVLSDGDFHPIVGAHSQAHVGTRSSAIRRPDARERVPTVAFDRFQGAYRRFNSCQKLRPSCQSFFGTLLGRHCPSSAKPLFTFARQVSGSHRAGSIGSRIRTLMA